MSDAHLADAIARLEEHHDLHLPLRRADVLGRLALRFLWLRELKWQLEVNLATKDAVQDISNGYSRLRTEVTELRERVPLDDSGNGLVGKRELATELESLHSELDGLRRSDQNIMAGLNQRIYALIGGVRTELSDLRLHLAEKAENSAEIDSRLRALEDAVGELTATAKDARLRHAQLDLFLERARRSTPAEPVADLISAVPERDAFLELAVAELLDGPSEQVRSRRESYLPTVAAARGNGATGEVFDMAPGRGEWFEVLRTKDVPYLAASRNPLLVQRCAELGCGLGEADPLDRLADTPKRSLGAVTAFRYAERLDPTTLARFVDLAAAAIQPGGVLIVETPHSVGPAAKDFHLDPFAQRPVHPTFLRFLAEAAGFAGVEVRYPDAGPLSAWPANLSAADAEGADRYCLIAWR